MKLTVKTNDPCKLETDLLVLFQFENDSLYFASLEDDLGRSAKEAALKEGFKGEKGESVFWTGRSGISAYKICLIGLGKKEKFDFNILQTAIGRAVSLSSGIKSRKIGIVCRNEFFLYNSPVSVIQSAAEAVILASYRFLKYKGVKEKAGTVEIEEVFIHVPASKINGADQAVKNGETKALATCFSRDLVNEPAEVTNPSYLSETAKTIAGDSKGNIKVEILEREAIEKLGMNAYLGVARGSAHPPKFIHLSYKPKNSRKKVVLVGKGITFDTGGLSLKPSESMETMKLDMAGAAALLGLFRYLPDLNIHAHVVGIIAACENMPSGTALRPGDILKAMNGKTIEVLNTDAEGRLTLADAFSYAVKKEKPDYIIDLATLTGACMVALGQDIAGLWSNNDRLAEMILQASKTSGEKIWRMPLEQDYKELLKSHIADLKNIQTGRYAGAITAALFLEEFVDDTSWAHLDIAGPAYAEKNSSLSPVGGTGFGVRLLMDFLQSI